MMGVRTLDWPLSRAPALNLNSRATLLFHQAVADADALRVGVLRREDGGTTLDFGIEAAGGLEAGLALTRICLAGLGTVAIVPGASDVCRGPAIDVHTDHPVAACLASQYAGWQVSIERYFAMGSGPMRAAAAREALYGDIGHAEQAADIVGVLETGKFPPPSACAMLAAACGVSPDRLHLAVVPTTSLAGTVQVVARAVETALHKLHELRFNVRRIESGHGVAPLPPVAANELTGIGRTNDAILYGAEVTLWVLGDDPSIEAIGPQVPSGASRDHGQPFAAIYERAGRDFYRIDRRLFSPAVVTFVNLDSGSTWRFGHTAPDVLERSFGGA